MLECSNTLSSSTTTPTTSATTSTTTFTMSIKFKTRLVGLIFKSCQLFLYSSSFDLS